MKIATRFILAISILSFFMIACNKTNTGIQKANNVTKKVSLRSDTFPLLIATIDNGSVSYSFNMGKFKDSLLQEGVLDIITECGIDYISDSLSNSGEAALFTIIGNKGNEAIAFQAELKVQGNGLYLLDPNDNPGVYAMHSCKGKDCSSCKVERASWKKLWKVTGCKCESGGGTCNHSVTTGGIWKFISILVGILGLFL